MEILTKRGELMELTRILKCSEPTVISALKFRTHTKLAQKIRETAKKRGGVEVK
jgi:hypothetical protein